MFSGALLLTSTIFALTVLLIMWRPFGVNESVPTMISAALILLIGIVPLSDVFQIFSIVSGAAITILSTIVMSIVLESIGFFRWAAYNLASRAGGSGILLFWYIILLCFLMTLFFNNDGSILITTPIIIQCLSLLGLKPHQKIPYLFSGALVATGASAPIGVSNLANLIALRIVGLDLNTYASMMFLPSMLGLVSIAFLLSIYYKKDIPKVIPKFSLSDQHYLTANPQQGHTNRYHPLSTDSASPPAPDWASFKICIAIVVLVRISFFALAPFGIPTEYPAIAGAILLIAVRWVRTGKNANDILLRTPWHILLFAFGMYVIIYGLHNVGLTDLIVRHLDGPVSSSRFGAILIMGLLLTAMSNLCNNLPSVMIGTLAITMMDLPQQFVQVAYLANVLGSDIGSLLLPMGTLASLIWMFILRKHHIPIRWSEYLKTTLFVIPVSLGISLLGLYLWTEWLWP